MTEKNSSKLKASKRVLFFCIYTTNITFNFDYRSVISWKLQHIGQENVTQMNNDNFTIAQHFIDLFVHILKKVYKEKNL